MSNQNHDGIATAKNLCMPFPLRKGEFIAQVILPRDMTMEEANRLCAFIRAIALPETPKDSNLERLAKAQSQAFNGAGRSNYDPSAPLRGNM